MAVWTVWTAMLWENFEHRHPASTSTLTVYVHLRRVRRLITLQPTSPNTQFTDYSGNESIICEVRATKCSGFGGPLVKDGVSAVESCDIITSYK